MQITVREKQHLAQDMANLLAVIPTIYCIGLSGGLASGSAGPDDDIDFFIITHKNTLFISRLLALCLLQFAGRRRRQGEEKAANKVCINMWIDTTALKFPTFSHDVYTAREIAQLKPLVDKRGTYYLFLQKNAWVLSLLPHAFDSPFSPNRKRGRQQLLEFLLGWSEPVARFIQLIFIRRHMTNETVDEHFLAFHPRDYRKEILNRFSRVLTRSGQIL